MCATRLDAGVIMMMKKRKYPIAGTDFFTQIMDDDGYYIDKTDVIPWLLARKKRVILFTRPRRFGKSTMMSMLKAFFEYRIDCDGKLVDNRHYFEGLKVSQDSEAMTLLGAYPVISITLKDVIQFSFKEALGALTNKIRLMFELCDWAWKYSSFTLQEKQRIFIQNILYGNPSPEDLQIRLRFCRAFFTMPPTATSLFSLMNTMFRYSLRFYTVIMMRCSRFCGR